MSRKRVYIAYTGGTIGITKGEGGYGPAPGFLAQQMAAMPELRVPSMSEYTIHEYAPLLDSSDMTPRAWLDISRDLAANYDAYDGFIVLHGTDTMAYAASALAFMLEGLRKPVTITGSQIPLAEVCNGARHNLIASLMIAADYAIPEVCLFFGHKLLSGRECREHQAGSADAEQTVARSAHNLWVNLDLLVEIRHWLPGPFSPVAPCSPPWIKDTGRVNPTPTAWRTFAFYGGGCFTAGRSQYDGGAEATDHHQGASYAVSCWPVTPCNSPRPLHRPVALDHGRLCYRPGPAPCLSTADYKYNPSLHSISLTFDVQFRSAATGEAAFKHGKDM